MTREPLQLTLYYREGCHLCDAMLQALRGLQPHLGFSILPVDIDRDAALQRRYDEWVPVLCYGERELCHYHLDERALVEVCSQTGSAAPVATGRQP